MVTVLAWTEQVKCRRLSEQPNYARVATKTCNMKLVIGITKISVNHNKYSFSHLQLSSGTPCLNPLQACQTLKLSSLHLAGCNILVPRS